ncbi:protein TolR [Methylolobus aquaticus]
MNAPRTRGRGRRRAMSEINVVPYIDVSLVLLIIFMVTAPMLQTGVDVDLPDANAKPIDAQAEFPVLVTIDAQGNLFVDVGNQGDRPVAAEALTRQIQAALARKPGRAVLIRGDRAVDYGRVITVMAALKEAGVPSVGLMTRPIEQ